MTTATHVELEKAADLVHLLFGPTPQYQWPLLTQRAGLDLWVKHENHTPTGAFKVRGGLTFLNDYVAGDQSKGLITATRGNHGQSIAYAASRFGISTTIVVPEGNNVEKNRAMQAWGGELIVQGHDFQSAAEFAASMADEKNLFMLPSFDGRLVQGVGTYAMELFGAVPDIDRVYVPIGLGSGICGVISARNALNLKTEIVGVVSENATTYQLSFNAGEPISTNSAETMADGIACRVPVPAAVETICANAADVVAVSDAEIRAAMRAYYTDTHNVVEGAGAAPLAAVMKDRSALAGKKVAVILTGGNVDASIYRTVLMETDQDEDS